MLTELLPVKLVLAAPNMLVLAAPKVVELLNPAEFPPNWPKVACWVPRDWTGGPALAVPEERVSQ